jgi:hypothetical protein
VNGTRKQTKKEDENKLTTLTFKMIPIFHNTLLATTKIKFFWGFCQFLGPTNQPTNHNFYGPKLKFYSGEIFSFEEASKLKFYCGALAHFGGPLGPFGVQGLKIKFYSGDIFPFAEYPKLKFYCGL